MTLSDIDTMQAIVVGPPIMITLPCKNAAAKGLRRSKFAGLRTPDGLPVGSAATAVWVSVGVRNDGPDI